MNLHPHNPQPAFHEGERAMQQSVGIADRMAQIGGQVIRDHLPPQHREFFAQLPFLVIGSVDVAGQPAASVLAAAPGFVSSPDDRSLHIAAQPDAADPLTRNLHAGASIGVLGIEPHTRRRNRANGIVTDINAHGIAVTVQQSFGNCPKYIQARKPVFDTTRAPGPSHASNMLDEAAVQLVKRADTFFIASAHPAAAHGADARAQGVDVSHRGGKSGFVRVDAGGVLTAPDFRGNFFFNTLGNLLVHPQAGLLFIDFDTGDLLQLDVDAELITHGAELASFAGAERLLRMHVKRALWRPAALPLRWSKAIDSPSLEDLGAWPDPQR